MQLNSDALTLARTHFHTLGSPRNFNLNPTATTLYFTRSASSTSNVQGLWQLDIHSGKESLLFDPLQQIGDSKMSPEELKQREVLRETSHGITGYTLSKDGKHLCFTYNGSLWLLDTRHGRAKKYKAAGSVFDPRFSPDGSIIGYVTADGVWTISLDTAAKPQLVVRNETPDIYWGRADFIASEEYERYRGFWWSPDGRRIVISQVDETGVQNTYGVPEDPWTEPTASRYPAAGTPNAVINVYIYHTETGKRHHINWDKNALPYLTNVQWNNIGLFITVQSRNQQQLALLKVSGTGKTSPRYQETAEPWIDIVQPLPYITDSGAVISLAGTLKRQLAYDGKPVTPAEHHVDDFIGIFEDWLLYTASPDPKERIVFAVNHATIENKQLSPAGGLFSAQATAGGIFVAGSVMGQSKKQRWIYADIHKIPTDVTIASVASLPKTQPKPIFFTVGPDELQACLMLPANYDKDGKLPVILQVYGGPHHQEVLYSRSSYLEHQWWTEQGYAVLTTDGPGSPGKNLAWEHQISGDLIAPAAAAHIAVLAEAIKRYPVLDSGRVASRGWSFGGYLSAFLSVLYPEQIQASISVAPVTDWRLYDTHYTERYLGLPGDNTAAYDTSSLLIAARKASRPILLVHGFHDDNVLVAHSLQLLQVLGEANCPYQFIPLSSVSHFPKEAEQRAWLLQMERDFLQARLAS